MNRRAVLATALAASLAEAGPTVAQSLFESGGLGLPMSDWEDMFGPGEAGQTYMAFMVDDGYYWVGAKGESRTVYYIERLWDDPQGVPMDVAEADALALLPADARFQERYDANFGHLFMGTRVDRYQSPTIAEQFDPEFGSFTRNFVVIYGKIPAPASMDSYVDRVVIMVGSRPES